MASAQSRESRKVRRRPGKPTGSGVSADRRGRPEPGGSGEAESWCGPLRGTRQAAGPKPGARCWPRDGPPPRPAPLGAPLGQRPQYSRLRHGPELPRLGPRQPPAWLPLPPGGPLLRPAAQRQPPPALPQPRCGQTGRRVGGPGQHGPRRAGARGTRHRRSLARAAAAESRRAPLGSPITQLASPASRATEGGSLGDSGAATGEERLSLALAPPRTAAVRLLSVSPLQAPPAAAGLGHRPEPDCRASSRSALAPATDAGGDQLRCRASSGRPIAGAPVKGGGERGGDGLAPPGGSEAGAGVWGCGVGEGGAQSPLPGDPRRALVGSSRAGLTR